MLLLMSRIINIKIIDIIYQKVCVLLASIKFGMEKHDMELNQSACEHVRCHMGASNDYF